MNRKKKIILLIVILILVTGAAAMYLHTRPKEVTNYDAEFEEDQEKPEETAAEEVSPAEDSENSETEE